MMNKIILPTILAATVLIVGVFAFMPIDEASTVHETIIQNTGGASATVSGLATVDDLNSATAWRNFILASDKPYTVHDVQIKADIDGPDCSNNKIIVDSIVFPAEYGTNMTKADVDGQDQRYFDDSEETVVDGSDSVLPNTFSMHVEDRDDEEGRNTFTQNTNIGIQLQFEAFCDTDLVDFTAEVIFYLRGVTDGDVTVTVVDDLDGDDDVTSE